VPRARLWKCTPAHFSWTDPILLAEELREAVATFAKAVRHQGDHWALLWCAGIGVPSSSIVALDPEWSAWIQLLDLIARHVIGPSPELPGSIFLASSAGAVYAGSPYPLVTETTPPRPLTEYGAHKLRMEEALRLWADWFPNVSFFIGRISSLYGPGQDLRKAQGVISHMSRCLIYHRPLNIYVPLDTQRNYLFVDDCAHQVAVSLRRLMIERPRAILKIFASEEPTCLARIVGIFFRVAKRRPLVITQLPRGTQLPSFQLRSNVWRNLEYVRKTDIATGIHMVHEHQLDLYRHGLLTPPP
jgi:UDP-glucose 4-epimerase